VPRLRAVEPRLSLVTLGVSDLARARAFYEKLGWRGQEAEETVFFQAGPMALILWGRDKLADDSGVADEPRGAFDGVVLAQNVRSAVEVDAIAVAAAEAGAEVTRAPAPTFYGGYAMCFRDPDGHVWEIAHNPGFTLGDDGSITLPHF
jgi:uncharacterized protein